MVSYDIHTMMVNTDLTQIVKSKHLICSALLIEYVYMRLHMVVISITSLCHHYYTLMHHVLPAIQFDFHPITKI